MHPASQDADSLDLDLELELDSLSSTSSSQPESHGQILQQQEHGHQQEQVDEDYYDDYDDSAYPDAPLVTPLQTQTQPQPLPKPPKWLLSPRRTSRNHCLHRIATALRPRRSWRYALCAAASLYVAWCLLRGSPLLASKLPSYTGAYGVGAVDVEVPLERPLLISNDTFFRRGAGAEEKRLAFEVETVLFTLYYPVSKAARETKPRHPWIERPVGLTAEGYAKFARVNNFLVRPVFTLALWAIAGSIKIPAKVDVPLFVSEGDQSSGSGVKEANEANEAKFPVTVFSHGMASSRTDYTHYVGELASRGHVVVALEHRDGSCPGTVIKINDRPDRRLTTFRESDLVSSPPIDTPTLKKHQLAFRDAEIFQAIKLLQSINDGHGAAVHAANSRGAEGSSLADWANRLDLDRLTIAGHSYGATGALQALRGSQSDPSIPHAAGGIALDPGKSSGPLNTNFSVPILVVHSNSWSATRSIFYDRLHFDTVRDLVRASLNRTGESWFMTSLGTSHPSVSDAPLIEPLILSWTTGAWLNVNEGLREYVRVSDDFLSYLGGGVAKGLLTEPVTHVEYGKWVSQERKQAVPKELARLWEIHVSPAST